MSHDIVLVPADVELGDPPSWDLLEEVTLGRREVVIGRLREVLPDLDTSDPDWLVLDRGTCSIEFNASAKEQGNVEPVVLHIHGDHNGAMSIVAELCDAMNCSAYECSSGGPADSDHGSAG